MQSTCSFNCWEDGGNRTRHTPCAGGPNSPIHPHMMSGHRQTEGGCFSQLSHLENAICGQECQCGKDNPLLLFHNLYVLFRNSQSQFRSTNWCHIISLLLHRARKHFILHSFLHSIRAWCVCVCSYMCGNVCVRVCAQYTLANA